MTTGIILASASPRREQLLFQAGCEFRVIPSGFYEDNAQGLPPDQLALVHARAKALDVAVKALPGELVIGADTVVALGAKVFGKPTDAADAKRMLSELSGKRHVVYTGVAVIQDGKTRETVEATAVAIRSLSENEIDAYVATGEPLDKAGAYAIQGMGALLVERIEGCYYNVVGLPLVALARLLSEAGVRLL